MARRRRGEDAEKTRRSRGEDPEKFQRRLGRPATGSFGPGSARARPGERRGHSGGQQVAARHCRAGRCAAVGAPARSMPARARGMECWSLCTGTRHAALVSMHWHAAWSASMLVSMHWHAHRDQHAALVSMHAGLYAAPARSMPARARGIQCQHAGGRCRTRVRAVC
jgi:hypothetical protein